METKQRLMSLEEQSGAPIRLTKLEGATLAQFLSDLARSNFQWARGGLMMNEQKSGTTKIYIEVDLPSSNISPLELKTLRDILFS